MPATARASAATLWPEHFDLAITIELPAGQGSTSASPPATRRPTSRTRTSAPWDRSGLDGPFWNAPFGALRTRHDVGTDAAVDAFLAEGIALVRSHGKARSERRPAP